MKSISCVRLHDVNNWFPRVTMAVPSPINVVMDISVSRIQSKSVATSHIFGRRLEVAVLTMGLGTEKWGLQVLSYFRKWSCHLTLGQLVHPNWNALPSFHVTRKNLSVWSWWNFEIFLCINCSSFWNWCGPLEVYTSIIIKYISSEMKLRNISKNGLNCS
jgi:hypothetical protein